MSNKGRHVPRKDTVLCKGGSGGEQGLTSGSTLEHRMGTTLFQGTLSRVLVCWRRHG